MFIISHSFTYVNRQLEVFLNQAYLPKTVTVLGVKYKVSQSEKVNKEMRKREWFGCINVGTNVIEVSTELSRERQFKTLLHEVVHAMLFDGVPKLNWQDEHMVNTIANALYVTDLSWIPKNKSKM